MALCFDASCVVTVDLREQAVMFSKKILLGLSAIIIAYLYSWLKGTTQKEETSEDDWDEAVFKSWETAITLPKHSFSKVIVG